MSEIIFKLYVTGNNQRAKNAINNLRECLGEYFEEHELEIIDVLESPDEAEADDIVATPTLIKTNPGPSQRVIGDMSNPQKIIRSLGFE
jgi:circadian clock protein KaiB